MCNFALGELYDSLADGHGNWLWQQLAALLNADPFLIREQTISFFYPGFLYVVKDISLFRYQVLSQYAAMCTA